MKTLIHSYANVCRHTRVCLLLSALLATSSHAIDGLPLTQFTLPDFMGSGQCAVCHSDLWDREGNDVSIDRDWRSTMMGNSAKDPVWLAKVSSETIRNPTLAAAIEEKCATCHMPMAYTEAPVLGSPSGITGSGFLNPDNPCHDAALDGVSCTLCHQVKADNLGQSSSFSGGYSIDTSTFPPNRSIFGPFPNPFVNQMRGWVEFTPLEGPQTTDSALCAVCHNLYTPYVDAGGQILGKFPEQMVYSEWANSVYASQSSCQDCHQPSASGAVLLSNRGGRGARIKPRTPFAQHHFVGGNSFMLELLENHIVPLQLSASSEQLALTRDRTLAQLQAATAQLIVTDVLLDQDELTVRLHIENRAGHKFPSGFPARRAWIHFTLADADGHVVFESGRPDAEGRISGNEADFTLGECEPHYDLITQESEIQIYESVMENTDGEITYTLLRGAAYHKDNRLLPDGFDKAGVPDDIKPAGAALADPNFNSGKDEIRYQVSIQGRPGPLLLTIELLYQTLAYAFVDNLRQDNSDLITQFTSAYDVTPKTPNSIATVALQIELP